MIFYKISYTKALRKHYESFFKTKGVKQYWSQITTNNINSDFYVLEIPPNNMHKMWTYLTVGMSNEKSDINTIELFIFSPEQNKSLVELLTMCASFHQSAEPLNLNHTLSIGRPWLGNSECNFLYISLPYLDEEKLEFFQFKGKTFHCYWLIL
ncbi:suppressor of fused domain protein [Aureibacter tunicatorum]|uniref:Suppressor of fused-like domain-containing protein n=1 Tax=Aureibacter tunicatorum TaxID=866807 RepID=A0AAE3XUB9_9BACT|nr:suppressor of fused domain protein [Aureibacter tunicatorum]MDR6242041.1 hypothetical protein [Aureibacter tunicatorum]BDD03616.1 hypothetical protein AUTU_10990 [Aureibacter tunicatorum]